MSHFAKVFDGKVINVIVAEPEFFTTFADPYPGEWIRTSYNTHGNVHYGQDGKPDGGLALRGNYASIGYNYDKVNDVFYPPPPHPDWVLNTSTWLWEAPIPKPDDGNSYGWDENSGNWVLVTPITPE